MSTVTHTTMHQDHKRWLSDNDMWRCDISAWQEEFKNAAAQLKEIESAVKNTKGLCKPMPPPFACVNRN